MLKKKLLTFMLTGAVIVGMVAPVTANAMTVDTTVKTVGAHRAAETAPLMLGGELATAGSNISANAISIFGSNYNTNPSALLYNYDTEDEEDAQTLILSNMIPPTMADTIVSGTNYVSETLSQAPDILLGTATNSTSGYNYTQLLTLAKNAGQIDSTYNPSQVAYACADLDDLVDTMYSLGAEIGTNGRYRDPDNNSATPDVSAVEIAKDYEKYVKATKYYVLKKLSEAQLTEEEIAAGKTQLDQKRVAVIAAGPSTGTYYLYGVTSATGTASNCRAAEYLYGTTVNIVDDSSVTKTQSGTKYVITQDELLSSDVDYIFTVGVQDTAADANALQDEIDARNSDNDTTNDVDATVVKRLPKTTYGIIMNSAENAIGVGIFQSIVYGDLNSSSDSRYDILDMNDAVAYFFQNFYHVKPECLHTLANDYYASIANNNINNMTIYGYISMANQSEATACAAQYTTVLNDGITYYNQNTAAMISLGLGLTQNYSN